MGTNLATQERAFSRSEISTIKRTVAKSLTDAEFDQFLHMCKATRLDPLRRQIYAIVTNADNPEKRAVAYVTGIDGYRAVAARTGNYRPGKRTFIKDESAKDPLSNPEGIVSATAISYQYAHGDWFEVEETVWWQEMAPLREIWEHNKPTGRFRLDPKKRNWHTMPGIMLMKCAEAQALRRAWPEDFAGLYAEDEIDVIDITPSEVANEIAQAERMEKVGGPKITFGHMEDAEEGCGFTMTSMPSGKVYDWLADWVHRHKDDPDAVANFRESNNDSLRQFWGIEGDAALEIRKRMDAVKEGTYDDKYAAG